MESRGYGDLSLVSHRPMGCDLGVCWLYMKKMPAALGTDACVLGEYHTEKCPPAMYNDKIELLPFYLRINVASLKI